MKTIDAGACIHKMVVTGLQKPYVIETSYEIAFTMRHIDQKNFDNI